MCSVLFSLAELAHKLHNSQCDGHINSNDNSWSAMSIVKPRTERSSYRYARSVECVDNSCIASTTATHQRRLKLFHCRHDPAPAWLRAVHGECNAATARSSRLLCIGHRDSPSPEACYEDNSRSEVVRSSAWCHIQQVCTKPDSRVLVRPATQLPALGTIGSARVSDVVRRVTIVHPRHRSYISARLRPW